ncbi:MAG: dienelactone hydrolase family protein [Candidatus Absconditabacterales bacterium]|nr:dienelactone hydrolase family protein [Candidatus Absconditabacterales bacterium]
MLYFLLLLTIILMGCTLSPTIHNTPTSSGSDIQNQSGTMQTGDTSSFDTLHANDMEHRDHTASTTTGTVSALALLQPTNPRPISEMMVEYSEGVEGFLVYNPDDSAATSIIMIHERWGLNDHIKDMARVLAQNGYTVLAVDLYRGQVATTRRSNEAE